MEIYIKPKKKTLLADKFEILIKDVADIVAKGDEAKKIEKIKILDIERDKKNKNEKIKNFSVSVTDIIKKIKQSYPNATINNVGENDTWVHCTFGKREENPWFVWFRVAIVSLILFVGAATAIMAFHTDGQIPKIFERFYTMLFGEEQKNPPLITIPYSIGLSLGIIIFYNHFFGKKITDDPTPIEVEIKQYEKEVAEAVIEMLDKVDKVGSDEK